MSAATVPLLAACEDPALFGFEPWPRQRELLAAVDDGPRLHVWALGRRSGKSTMAAVVCLHNLLFRPDLDALVRPGERRYAVAVATNVGQARLIVRAARSIVERSPLLAPLMVGGDVDSIEFAPAGAGGARCVLEAFPCTARGRRGFPISCLVFDEAAHFLSDSEGDATAEQVWRALHPATVQFGDGASVIVSSTPFGDAGFFADTFARAASGELPNSSAARMPTSEVNPTITADYLEAERLRDPEAFAEEYEAAFLGAGAAFFDFDRIALVDREPAEPLEGTGWVAGLDPAFARDPFGIALLGRDVIDPTRLIMGPVHGLTPRRPGASPEQRAAVTEELLGTVVAECKRFRAQAVTDQHEQVGVVARLTGQGVPVHVKAMTLTAKTEIYEALRSALYDGSLELRDDRATVSELRRIRTRYTRGARAVDTPRVAGSHGDRAQALALAAWYLTRYGGASSHAVRGGPDGLIVGNALAIEF